VSWKFTLGSNLELRQIAFMLESLQDRYAPTTVCFGCGPANEKGLRIKSHVEGNEVVLRWTPQAHHQAFNGVVNGGIVGALFDCHCNWTAAWKLMTDRGLDAPPCTVTAEFHVKLRAPTPLGSELIVRARAVDVQGDKVVVEATMQASGRVTATCRGVFVSVKEGHPAWHRW
jgi:acyl-coenzyme A thioesterase PaaI-like protein